MTGIAGLRAGVAQLFLAFFEHRRQGGEPVT
jgi:hypothetical protein